MTKAVPYFPLYAANFLSSRPFRVMNLEQRGLWITIMMECWVNGSVPANHIDLSKLLGVDLDALKRSLTELQTAFFEKKGDELICLELEEYRKGYEERREKQKEGGKRGAENKKEKQRQAIEGEGTAQGLPSGQPKGHLNYVNSTQVNSNYLQSNQTIRKEMLSLENKEWVEEYEKSPAAAISYRNASRG
jgi:uncharacterized protein YdaU (DUF1376 family)